MKREKILILLVVLIVFGGLYVIADFNDFGETVIDDLNITNGITMNYSSPVNITGPDCILFHSGGQICDSP